jgi:hypothetical protein
MPGGILQQDVLHYPATGKHMPSLSRLMDLLIIGKTAVELQVEIYFLGKV